MKLPENYDDHSGLTPAMIMAIVTAGFFVAVVLLIVLFGNNDNGGHEPRVQTDQGKSLYSVIDDEPQDELAQGSGLHPGDLDFWDRFPPEETEEPSGTNTPEPQKEEAQNDPSTDGKHTLVKNISGEDEWVLINSYLPKNDYDFTKLVCQSGWMKYYEEGRQVSFEGINISENQDYVDFAAVKKAGVDFVMLRAGARGYGTGQLILDEYFLDNLKRASDAGLSVGVYFFSQAITEKEAIEEADMVIENLGDYSISYPVAFDMERILNVNARTDSLSKAERTDITKAFLDRIEDAGYNTAIYGDKEWLIKQIDMSKLTAYDVWLSQEEDIPDYPYMFTMWQYNRGGTVDGVAGYVDLNISFVDYSER